MSLSLNIRIERLITFSRASLASFSWLANWIDPFEPAKISSLIFGILDVYLIYAWLLIPLLMAFPMKSRQISIISHTVDIVLITLLVVVTQGFASPFFSYFIFVLFAGALRWQKPGVIFTGFAFLSIYLAATVFLELNNKLDGTGWELNRFIIRNVHLVVVSLLLIYLTNIEKKIREELAKLSEWPLINPVGSSLSEFIRDTLTYTLNVLDAPRLLMVWEENDGTSSYFAAIDQHRYLIQPISPTDYKKLTPVIKTGSPFFCNNLKSNQAKTYYLTERGISSQNQKPLNEELIAEQNIDSVLGLPLRGQSYQGYLLLLDKPSQTSDALKFGILAAQQVITRMDQFFMHAQQQKNAAIDERIKMARDLHDGVLQTLTGIALQVKNIEKSLETDPESAKQTLSNLGNLIQTEQRNLRIFIQQLKPEGAGKNLIVADLVDRLKESAAIIQKQWGLQVTLSLAPVYCPSSQVEEIYHLVREAMINCGKHANANKLDIKILGTSKYINIYVIDDGHGFPFEGDFTLSELVEMNIGPKTIIERVVAFGGSLMLSTYNKGTSMEFILPFHETDKPF